jgi:MFS family permease
VIGNVANFVGGLFWGRLADLSGRYKLTLLVTNASSVFFNFCLLTNSITSVFWLFLVDVVLASFFGSCWGTLIDAVAVIGSEPGSSYGKLRFVSSL